MASVIDSLRRSTINIQNISKSLSDTKTSVSAVNKSVDNISKIIATNTRIKSELFSRSQVLDSRREEASKRQENEDIVEASQVSTSTTRGFAFSSKSDKGPLGRLLGFLGFITAGWIVENLPTWIFMGKEFISRIETFGRSMYNMVGDIKLIVQGFGDLMKTSFSAIIKLDFNEFSEGSVAQSFDELNSAVQGLGDDITETFRLFTTPLTEALETGEQAPGLGEQREDTMFPGISQEPGAPSRVTGTAKQALDIISKYESQSAGGYEAVNQIGIKGGYGTLGYSGSFGGMKQHKGQKLTQMSVREIMELQRDIPGMSNAEWIKRGRLHAVGRYQIIGSTLKGLVNKGVIKPSDTFDETTQDVAGMYILKTSGIGAYYGPKAYATSKERAIIEKARKEPVSYSSTPSGTRTPSLPSSPQIKGKTPGYSQAVSFGKSLLSKGYKNIWQHPDFNWSSGYTGSGKERVAPRDYNSYHNYGEALDISAYNGEGKLDALYVELNKNRGKYGIAELLWRTKGHQDHLHISFNKTGATLTESKPSAQISAQPKSQQPASITPERKGSQIMFIDATQPQVSQVSYSPAQQSSPTPTISEFKLLNNFIKNKLLIDLAYL